MQGDTIFATSNIDSTLLFSANQGNKWNIVSKLGLPSSDFVSLVMIQDELYAELLSGEIYRTTIPKFLDVRSLSVGQHESLIVYPNPVSSWAAVSYNLSIPQLVSVTLHDALGREAASPITKQLQNAGAHEINLGIRNLNLGIYSISLFTGANEIFAKFIVLH